MSIKTALASVFGFTSTAEATIKADAADVVSKAKTLEQRVTEAFHPSAPVVGPTSSTVGTVSSLLVASAGKCGLTVDALVAQIAGLTEELRQQRQARTAVITALMVLAKDAALTDDERTAISLEVEDYGADAIKGDSAKPAVAKIVTGAVSVPASAFTMPAASGDGEQAKKATNSDVLKL